MASVARGPRPADEFSDAAAIAPTAGQLGRGATRREDLDHVYRRLAASPHPGRIAAGADPHAGDRHPPLETGERNRTIVRTDDEELRINWALYEGNPYVSLRMWTRDRSGRWWPDSKRGLSIRLRELEDVADAIAAAQDLAAEHRDRRTRRDAPARREPRHARVAPRPDVLPLPSAPVEFDEFAGPSG